MSDPVTNAEIEDVLSAVRRLVSAGGDTRRPANGAPAAGKLVLTPAFRVDIDEAPEAEVAPKTPASSSLESLVQDAIGADDFGLKPRGEDAVSEDDTPEATEDAMSLEDRIAELEAVVTHSATGGWDDDEAEDEGDEPSTDAHPMFEDLEEDEAPMASMVEAPDPDPVGIGEAVEMDTQDWEDVEEDAPEVGFGAASSEPYEDADYTAHGDEALEGFEAPEGNGDDMVIDEDMLREIVGRLVREELQGTMGERITRNLRRMVRREIARAMALKDFD